MHLSDSLEQSNPSTSSWQHTVFRGFVSDIYNQLQEKPKYSYPRQNVDQMTY